MDFDHLPPFPPRFEGPLRAAVRGQQMEWPTEMTAAERDAIEIHGMLPLVEHFSMGDRGGSATHRAAIEALRLVDLRRVLASLSSAGVAPLILKGTALGYLVYSRPELRPRTDVDLLIDRGDREAVRKAFHELGFALRPAGGDELGMRQESFAGNDSFSLRHVYDVHFDITNNAVTADALRYEELRRRGQPVFEIGSDALAPGHVDSLLYACIHRAVHHYDSERLIWLHDIQLLRRAMTEEDHRTFWTEAAARKVVGICRRGVERAEEWFGKIEIGGAAHFLDAATLSQREPSEGFLVSGRRRAGILFADLGALPGWRARAQRIRQLAFPSREYLAPGRSRLVLPWLYTLRAARGLARLLRRVG